MMVVLIVFIALNALHTTWSSVVRNHNKLNMIGGDRLTIAEAPYMAAVFLDKEYWCGASVIDERFVLTAATCFVDSSPNDNWRVLVGSENLNLGGHFLDVQMVYCHEDYDPYTSSHDICLLQLTRSITFGCFWNVDKVELPDDGRQILEGTMATVTGWGYTKNNGYISNQLQQVRMPVVPKECCVRVYTDVTEYAICAGSSGRDVCDGDVGAPLVYNGILIGVLSYGWDKCGTHPSVFTNVGSYLPWIQNTTSSTIGIQQYSQGDQALKTTPEALIDEDLFLQRHF